MTEEEWLRSSPFDEPYYFVRDRITIRQARLIMVARLFFEHDLFFDPRIVEAVHAAGTMR